jgi:hypothetical protein
LGVRFEVPGHLDLAPADGVTPIKDGVAYRLTEADLRRVRERTDPRRRLMRVTICNCAGWRCYPLLQKKEDRKAS